jgi:ABC-type Fe3+-hydroxamate transport system substrate-binding protein
VRVVSLVPSAAEILALIGAADLLVGRSHECDFPPTVTDRPALTGSRTRADFASAAASRAIDEQVRSVTAAAEPLYTLDAGLLADLKPDLILTQGVCSVCSIDQEAVESVAGRMSPSPRVLSLNPTTVEGVLDDILRVGRAVGRERAAMHAVVALRERADRALEHVNPYVDGPVVGFMEWTDPVFIAGHWTVQLIERAGGRHPLNETVAKPGSGAAVGPQQAERVAGHSIAVSPEVFAAARPEAVVIAPCGLTLEQAWSQTGHLAEQRWFQDLPAVRAGRVAVVDGNQMFNRPGPRLFDALEFLVGWLNGREDLIPADFPWRAWPSEPRPTGHSVRTNS